MNGIVDIEQVSLRKSYLKFPCPFVQKRLFNYFARELYQKMDGLYGPFEDLSDTITDNHLNIRQLLLRYEHYLQTNRERVLKNAPRRQDDLRVYEAIFHFHFYLYLVNFLRSYEAEVYPEFPTGNGQIDLLTDVTHSCSQTIVAKRCFALQKIQSYFGVQSNALQLVNEDA